MLGIECRYCHVEAITTINDKPVCNSRCCQIKAKTRVIGFGRK